MSDTEDKDSGPTIGERLGTPSLERAAAAPEGEHVGPVRTEAAPVAPVADASAIDEAKAKRDELIVAAMFTL